MKTERDQVTTADPRRRRKLVLHKETIKNMEVNGLQKHGPAPYPTGCDCTDHCSHDSHSCEPI